MKVSGRDTANAVGEMEEQKNEEEEDGCGEKSFTAGGVSSPASL